jgi:tetratricopeptide (TPR) repeat protein
MDIQDFMIQGDGREEDKREAWKYFQEAYERQMRGDLEEAAALYKRSIEMHPTAEAHTFLGWTYHFMGKLDDAIEECHRSNDIRRAKD